MNRRPSSRASAWSPPTAGRSRPTSSSFEPEAKKWLKANAEKYRIKRFVDEKDEKKP